MEIKAFYDEATYTLTYVVWDESSRDAVVIDPVLNYDPLGSQTSTESVDEITDFLHEQDLQLRAILETHAHADHISGSQVLKHRFGAPVVIGRTITKVQETFKGIFELGDDFATDGSQFDKLIDDGEIWRVGSLAIEAIATPGHTPACMTYKIEDAIFTGDALFMHDYGTGRTDFPKGSSQELYRSIHERLYTLPDDTRVFVGHDYQPGQRELRYETTIGKSKRCNPQLNAQTTEHEFVEMRDARDAQLAAPRLLFQSVQVNVNAGRMPEARSNGVRYLKLPLNLFRPADERGEPIQQPKAAE
jgi:glyoxylase-like metal-dependent hydrolase (beta-lactamase superfamily II)